MSRNKVNLYDRSYPETQDEADKIFEQLLYDWKDRPVYNDRPDFKKLRENNVKSIKQTTNKETPNISTPNTVDNMFESSKQQATDNALNKAMDAVTKSILSDTQERKQKESITNDGKQTVNPTEVMAELVDTEVSPALGAKAEAKAANAPIGFDNNNPYGLPSVVTNGSGLPPEVLKSIKESTALEKQANKLRMQQTQLLMQELTTGVKKIQEAKNKIVEIERNPISNLLAIMDSKFDVRTYRAEIERISTELKTKQELYNLENDKINLQIANASAPYREYMKIQEMKSKKAGFTAAELMNFSTSVSARKQGETYLFNQATHEKIMDVVKNKAYDSVFTPKRVTDYMAAMATLEREAANLRNAKAAKDIKTEIEIEARALDVAPKSYLEFKLEESVKANSPFVDLGDGILVNRAKVTAEIQKKREVFDKERARLMDDAIKGLNNQTTFNEIQYGVGVLSSEYSNTPVDLTGMRVPTVTDKVVNNINYQNIDPRISSEYFAYMKTLAQVNGKEQPSQQDIGTLEKLGISLRDKVKAVQEETIKTQPNKRLQAAYKDFFEHGGTIKSPQNAAEITYSNLGIMPNFKGDKAFENAWMVFAENMLDDIGDKKTSVLNEKGDIDKKLLLESALENIVRTKKGSSELVLTNITRMNEKKQSAFSAFVNTKANEIITKAVARLSKDSAELQQRLFDAEGNPVGNWTTNQKGLAYMLANISFGLQKRDPTLPNNYMNNRLEEEINAVLMEEASNLQTKGGINIASFKSLLFRGRDPMQYIDAAISKKWGRHAVQLWPTVIAERTGQSPDRQQHGRNFAK